MRGEFLGRLDIGERSALNELADRRRWAAHERIFAQGRTAQIVVILLSGAVKVYSRSRDGKEIVYAFLGPGALLGEFAAFDQQPSSATVTAVERVEALVLPADRFVEFLLAHPRVTVLLLQLLVQRLRDADRRCAEFGTQDTLTRVTRRLVELAERLGKRIAGGPHIALAVSQDELAGWVGSSREAVAKALRVLRTRGYIDTRRRAIVVLDLPGLRQRA